MKNKKEFERPSQKQVEVASQDGVSVVVDVPTNEAPKEVGGVASRFAKYNEVVDASKINCFKPTLIRKADSNFLNMGVKEMFNYEFPLATVKMLSMRFKLKDIKKKLIEKVESFVVADIATKRAIDYDQRYNDAEFRMLAGVITDVKFAHSKEKEFIAVLDKNTILQNMDETKDLLKQMQNDPKFKINTEVVPTFIKMLAVEPFEIKHYGEELVIVLDIDKVMANVMIPSVLNTTADFSLMDYVKLGKSVYSVGGYVNTAITIDGVPSSDESRIMVSEDQFVCGRFQFSHEAFRNVLVGEGKPLTNMSKGSDIIYVRTANIAAQQSGAEALKLQMTGLPSGINYTMVPLIKISKAEFTKKYKATGNPLLDSLLDNSSRVELIDTQAVLKSYSLVLDGKVFSFNVGVSSGRDLCILPNYRNLVALALFGMKVLTKGKLPKIDITDNGHAVAVAVSL